MLTLTLPPRPAAALLSLFFLTTAPRAAIAQDAPAKSSTVSVTAQYRGRVEQQERLSLPAAPDRYYLNRVRLSAKVVPVAWMNSLVQLQDARAFAYDAPQVPANVQDHLDLRQAYVDVRAPAATGVSVRAGRQELTLGDQRLVGISDWTNTARSFDALRLDLVRSRFRVRSFVSSVVVPQEGFDRRKHGETFSGGSIAIERVAPGGVVEPYVLARVQPGNALYAFGTRVAGTVTGGVDYNVEVAAQRGHQAADDVAARAGHYGVGWTIDAPHMKPRLTLEFNHASGDSDPTDATHETFDQLYPTNHGRYGLADQIGWRNMRETIVGLEATPHPRLKLNANVEWMLLATTNDALYFAGGAVNVLNRAATSRAVGSECDLQAAWTVSKQLRVGAGVAAFLPGAYLAHIRARTMWSPYLTWVVNLE